MSLRNSDGAEVVELLDFGEGEGSQVVYCLGHTRRAMRLKAETDKAPRLLRAVLPGLLSSAFTVPAGAS